MLVQTTRGHTTCRFLNDGAVPPKDLISEAALTMTGGVGTGFTEPSNYRTVLGVKAPVFSGATDNLLADNDTLTQNSIGAWGDAGIHNCTLTASTLSPWEGYSYSGKMTVTADDGAYCLKSITAVTSAGGQYTYSAQVKGVAGRSYVLAIYDNASTPTVTYGAPITANGNGYARLTCTTTFNAASTTRLLYIMASSAKAGDIVYWSAVQIESGATATSFCLGARVASSAAITCPIAAGQAYSILIAATMPNDPTTDGSRHTFATYGTYAAPSSMFLDINNSTGQLRWIIYDNAGAPKGFTKSIAWAAGTTHIIIAERAANGTMKLYFDGADLGALSYATGTGLESTLTGNIQFGTSGSIHHLRGVMLGALWNRVLTTQEITDLSAMTDWNTALSTATQRYLYVSGFSAGNAVRIYSAGAVVGSGVLGAGATQINYTTAPYTLANGCDLSIKVYSDSTYSTVIDEWPKNGSTNTGVHPGAVFQYAADETGGKPWGVPFDIRKLAPKKGLITTQR